MGAKFSNGIVGLLICCGCAGSASMLLKSPVSNQCANAGLQGCDELSEGVLLHLDGKTAEARPKLAKGAAQNSPEKVKKFLELLQTLKETPGAGKYAASLDQVVAVLKADIRGPERSPNDVSEGEAIDRSHSASRERGNGPMAHGDRRGVVTADTDIGQIRDGLVKAPTGSPRWCTEVFGRGTTCRVLSRGPLFLTDLSPMGNDCEGQFVAVMEGIQVRAKVESPVRVHGARIVVVEKHTLVLGQRPLEPFETGDEAAEPEDVVTVVLDETPEERTCSLYWSGFVPYEINPYQGEQPSTEWEF
jgi:hypothetical protein